MRSKPLGWIEKCVRASAAVLLLVGCSSLLGIDSGRVQGACTSDAQCAPGFGCVLGACRSGCIADGDCGSGSRCLRAIGSSACVPVSESCDSGCPDGTVCTASVCRTTCKVDGQCLSDQSCTVGICIGNDPTHETSADAGTGGTSGGGGSHAGGMSAGGTNTGGKSAGGEAGVTSQGGDAGALSEAPALGLPCATAAEVVCTAAAQSERLICTGGTWHQGTACAADQNCDQGDGQCQAIVSACKDLAAGQLYCDNNTLSRCGPDLVTTESVKTCTGTCAATATTASCVAASCGDGQVEVGEDCDDKNTDNSDACVSGCKNASCGDGYLWQGKETCDYNAAATANLCARSCEYSIWALWPVPDDLGAHPPSYDTTVAGVVTDKVTKLIWQRAVDLGSYTWDTAKTYCGSLALAGFTDWRLPTRIELVSILGAGFSPTIDGTAFPSTPAANFWTSSAAVFPPSSAFAVGFTSATTTTETVTGSLRVRCVR